MKKLSYSQFCRTIISLILFVCLLFQMVSCASQTAEVSPHSETVKVETKSEKEVAFTDDEGNEILYDSEEGTLHYLYNGAYHLIEIVDVSEEGIIEWKISSDELKLSGYANSNGAPETQAAIVVGGTAILVGKLLTYVGGYITKIAIAGTTCYLASVAAQAIKKASREASYYPAYQMFGNVYVATPIGLSKSKAVSYIKRGKSVWAKSRSLARSACKSASPIGAAEYGWHGSMKDGYYPHYHAVKKYIGKTKYTHTGAHCWFMP